MRATLPPDDARELLRRGAFFGDVYELVAAADRAELAEWFVREPGLPNLAARQAAHRAAPSGDPCPRCGGPLVRTGTCLTCQDCGESSGGCA